MVGAVFFQEMVLGGRRFHLHVFRWIYASWLILQVFYFLINYLIKAWYLYGPGHMGSTPEIVGAQFATFFIGQQAVLLFLGTPAVVAGSITDEKRKGTLQHLLLTEMEPRHIILGKLLGRVCQVLLVLMAGMPLFALMAGFGGVPPLAMLMVGASLVLPVFGLASMTILAAVWCEQTWAAALAVIISSAVLLLVGCGVGLPHLYPIFVIWPVWAPEGAMDFPLSLNRLLIGGAAWAMIGSVCLVVAGWHLVPSYLNEVLNEGNRRSAWFNEEREPIEEDPVQWREQHVEGLSPISLLKRFPQWLGITLVAGLTTLSGLFILWWFTVKGTTLPAVCRALLSLNVREFQTMAPDAHVGFLIQGVVVMLLFSLIVGIRCSGAVTGEREQQTWEAVLMTPMSAKQVLHGKLWGVMTASAWYLVAYAGPALALSILGGPLAFAFVVLWFAVTILAMYFIGSAGLWCSVQASNSWSGLLNTMLVGYLGGLAIYTVTFPGIAILVVFMLLILWFVDQFLGTNIAQLCAGNWTYLMRVFWASSGIGLAIIFFLLSRMFLSRAQRWIADRERTRHWHAEDEAYYRRPRRAMMGDGRD
jgi:ABC-type Na+ efflux pump permease subunit